MKNAKLVALAALLSSAGLIGACSLGLKDLGSAAEISECGGFSSARSASLDSGGASCGDDILRWSYSEDSMLLSLVNEGSF